MKDVYNEEKLDKFGNVKKPTRTTVKRKRKEKPVNTDSEDNDFRGIVIQVPMTAKSRMLLRMTR
jgi:hypothetical protein